MPGDTLIKINDKIIFIDEQGDTITLNDSISQAINSQMEHFSKNSGDNNVHSTTWFAILLVIIILSLLILFFQGYFSQKRRVGKALKMFAEKGPLLDATLVKYNNFYRTLKTNLKERFLLRTIEFMQSKTFVYHQMEKDEEIEILVSAASIQVSFGLKNYLMSYFKQIHILRTDYHFGQYSIPFMGHVNSTGIYLSLKNFIEGFKNYSDASNVGLHEMAHALAYVNFSVKGIDEDIAFKRRFEEFSATARPIFEKMKSGESTFLDSYAATNYQEFWAVCVEAFFESSEVFRTKMPDLYTAMCQLMKQDPLFISTIHSA